MNKLASEIRLRRKQAKMTQAQLADKIGVSTPTIVKFEKSVMDCKMSTLWDVAHALGCSLTVRVVDHENDEL